MVEEYPDEDVNEDLEEDQLEEQVERQQEVYDNISPTQKEKDDLFSLFWKVIQTTDSSKVGNLDKSELGMLNMSVRDCQRIRLLANTLGHPGFADFFRLQGELILATSSSKKGWLPELFVSQRKFTTKSREFPEQRLQPKKKKGLFSK